MIKKRYFLLTLFLGLTLLVQAQNKMYDDIHVDLSGATSVLQNSFSNSWEASPGVKIAVRANYHLGQLEAGGRFTRFSSDNINYKEAAFTSYFIYIGWQYNIKIAKNLTLSPGLRFGDNLMFFNDNPTYTPDEDHKGGGVYEFNSTESEFGYELFGRLEYTLEKSPWSFQTSFSYNRTLTYHPLPVGYISFGISRSFSSPNWLKNFLQ